MSAEPADSRVVSDRGTRYRTALGERIQTASIGLVLLLLFIGFALTTDAFFTSGNLLNLVRQSAPTMIVAVAMTFVITTAGIDLSVGSIVALTGSLLALFIRDGLDPTLALLAVLAVGTGVGVLNGWFSAYAGLPAFIVTLASLTIVRGVALQATQGYSTPIDSGLWIVQLGQGRIAGIPVPALFVVVAAALGWVVLTQTRFGQYVTGIGSNAEATRRSGIDIRRVGLAVYALSGLAAAFAGVLVATRLSSGSSNAGQLFELEVITAVVLGGTSLFGGRGTVVGTILGALTIGVISNGLILLHVSPFYVPIVQGSILLLAIFANEKLFSRFTQVRR